MDPVSHTPTDVYIHIRVIIGIILGLSLSKLLSGLAGFIQHPSRQRVFATHLVWVFFALLSLVHFWWFEFYLNGVHRWTFGVYLLVIAYASLYYLVSVLLFPDKMEEYAGYSEYFLSRRKWFFGLIALIFLMDIADTAIKGSEHFFSFGLIYPLRNIAFVAAALVAIRTSNRRFHLTFAIAALLAQILWIWREFGALG